MHRVAFAMLLAASFALSGCTFIGMGIGAAASKTTPVAGAHLDDDVVVTTTDGQRTEGTVTQTNANGITVALRGTCGTPERPRVCREWRQRSERILAIEKHESYVGLGAGIGAIIDVACLVASVVAYGVLKNGGLGSSFGAGAFAASEGAAGVRLP
jgi:hypothetical protein